MSAKEKIEQYAIANGKSIQDLIDMGKAAVVAAAGLTRTEARGLGKAIKRYKAELAKEVTDSKLENITTRLQAGTLPPQPSAVVEEVEPGVSYKVTV